VMMIIVTIITTRDCCKLHDRFFFIIPVYLQSVQVHSVDWLKEVDECLGEGRSLALFYN
jgi:hypothetical protein